MNYNTPFDSATILADTSVLQLTNFGEWTTDEHGHKTAPAIVMGEYKLKLTVGDTLKE